jgi:L-alanine-DL-glutamate epimerase-like enolase superfamily enzyme
MAELKIAKIEAWACVVPLQEHLDFGAFQVSSRKHTVVRVSTTDGIVAEVVGQSRGAPIDVAILDLIAPLCLERSASDLPEIQHHVAQSLAALELEGTLGRAWSLVEICINDIRAQAAGVPLWRWLGGKPDPVKVMMVEGYALAKEDDKAFADRVASRASEGYQLIKMEAAHYQSTEELINRLAACNEVLPNGTELVLDFAWSWIDAKSKISLLRELDEFNVKWLEDPFPRTKVAAYVELRKLTQLPVACGDETTRAQDILDLIDAAAIDIVRLDATTVGGIEQSRLIIDAAKQKSLPVSFHEHPEVHEHLVFGLGCADHVEIFPKDRPFDRVHELWESTLFDRIEAGYLYPHDSPGCGIRLRPDSVGKYSVRSGCQEI